MYRPFAEEKYGSCSDKYTYIPTIMKNILKRLEFAKKYNKFMASLKGEYGSQCQMTTECICLGRNVDIVEIFESCNWLKKLEHPCPDYDVVKIFNVGAGEKLQEYLDSHAEDTPEVTRSLFLFTDSGEFRVAVIEQPYNQGQ